jgi:DNA invertase Pin-like site-specific DNA recombinase
MKRLGRDAAELTALADHLTENGLVLEMLAGPLPGLYDPTGPGKLLFGFFAAMAETERENIRESTLEGLETAARKGKYGGRPPVITDDMLHTVLRRKTLGESVEQIQPDLIIPTGKRKGQNPSVASIYRALAEHEKAQAYPEAVETAHDDFAALQQRDRSPCSYSVLLATWRQLYENWAYLGAPGRGRRVAGGKQQRVTGTQAAQARKCRASPGE